MATGWNPPRFFHQICFTCECRSSWNTRTKLCRGDLGAACRYPDSGIGLGTRVRTERRGEGRRRQTDESAPGSTKTAGSQMTPGELVTGEAPEEIPRGTPRKRALFGIGCCESELPGDNVAEAQAGLPADSDAPGWTYSIEATLTDMVA